MGQLDKLADQYGVKVAIHNHPKDPKKPSYVNWDPKHVMQMIQGCSKNIGCCADTGHWVRSGLDPVASLKMYEGRLMCLHMKDLDARARTGHDVPYGTGVSDIRAQLAELRRQGFRGVIAIEYESKKEDALPDVRQCAAYFNQVVNELAR
jgi:sugar phosphate isomerase/epimerase